MEQLPIYGTIPKFTLPEEFVKAKITIERQGLYNRQHLPADTLVAIYPGLIDGDITQSLNRWRSDLPQEDNWLVSGLHYAPHQDALANLATQSRWAGFQPTAYSTPEQAQWVIAELQLLGTESVVLYAARFHAPRVFGTTVKAAQLAGWNGTMTIVTWDPPTFTPLTLAGFSDTPQYQELFPGEWKLWVDSTNQGDVAAPHSWQEYLPE